MSDQVDGGDDDGVVYMGRSSFKMTVGGQATPPAGTAASRLTPTPPASRLTPTPPPSHLTPTPPSLKTPPPVRVTPSLRASRLTPTPPPSLKTPRPSGMSYRRLPTPMPLENPPVPPAGKAKVMVVGLCMIAFSCGVISTVAVDRFWPRARAQCGGGQSETAIAAPAIPAAVTETPPADPAPAEKAATAAQPEPAVPATRAAGATAPPAAAPAARATTAPPAAGPAASKSPVKRGPAVTRVPPTQARVSARKPSPGTASVPASDTMPPTEGWTDPFNQ